jgi:hypothetical protein
MFKRHYNKDSNSLAKNIIAGGVSGVIGTLIGTPGDVIKIRLVNDLNGTKYKSEVFDILEIRFA